MHTVKLRAGTIEKKIRYAKARCSNEACNTIFANGDYKIDGIFFETGFIQRPTKSTVKICETIYRLFLIHNNDIYNFDYDDFYRKILNAIPFDILYTHIDFSHDPDHKSQYILLIIDEYIRMHCTYLARIETLDSHAKLIGKTVYKLKHNLGQ